MEKIKLGISSCLLGNNVRYDGGHKQDKFLTHILGKYVDYIPVCPEVESGLGVPRAPMRLEGNLLSHRLMITGTGKDLTGRMLAWASKKAGKLAKEQLCGFIFKSASPSCGMERVKIYGEKSKPVKNGVGLFAEFFMSRFPLLPVADEIRLHDPGLRDHFIQSIFVLARWHELLGTGNFKENLMDFHTKHELLILSHSTRHYQEMCRLMAARGNYSSQSLRKKYMELLLQSLAFKTTPAKHAHVLCRMMGYLKKCLSADEKIKLLNLINQYRRGLVALNVPVTLIIHYAGKYNVAYVKRQVYFNPHPVQSQLQRHV
jgi:uncharacterized protein YbbK (DUF523 family)/uncharacterized protein YbgA (DUF1722 family)